MSEPEVVPEIACISCDKKGVALCVGCIDRGKRQLHGMPRLYVALSLAVAAGKTPGEPLSGSRDLPIPVRADVLDVMADITEFVETWEDAHRKWRGFYRRDQYGRQAFRLGTANRYLETHYDSVIDMDHNVVVAINYWTRRAERTLQTTRLIHHLPAPCPTCDQVRLYRESGDDAVHCGHCGARWCEDEYQRLVHILAYEIQSKGAAS